MSDRDYLIKGDMYQYELGWLIKELMSFKQDLATAIDLKTIKYADPIQWDITNQYPANTVVVDPKSGTAYMSKVPVPAGVELDNDNYWVVVFNYQDIYNKIMDGVAFNDRDQDYATKDLLVNDLVWYAGDLYRVTRAIPKGSKYIPETNLIKTSIESLLAQYYGKDRTAQVNNDTVNVSGDYTLVAGDIAETSTNRTIKVIKDREIDVDGSDSVHIDGVSTVNVGGLRTEVYAGDKTEKVTGTATEEYIGTHTENHTGKKIVNAENIILNSTNPIDYKEPSPLNDYFDCIPLKHNNNEYHVLVDNNKFYDSLNKRYARIGKLTGELLWRTIRNNDMGGAQCIAKYGSQYVACGEKSNFKQFIAIFDSSGNKLTEREYTDLGHANGIVYVDGYFYVVTAKDDYNIIVIDASTMSIAKTIRGQGFHMFGIATYNDKIYLCNSDQIAMLNTDDTISVLCNYQIPNAANFLYFVRQNFGCDGKYAYLLVNRNNAIIKILLATGEIIDIYNLDEGNGFYPYGEIESCYFDNGYLFLTGGLYYSTNRGVFISPFFKFNLNNNLIISGLYGQTIPVTPNNIYVDSNTTIPNPSGIDSNSPFKSLEEAIIVAQYRNKTMSTVCDINILQNSDFSTESVLADNTSFNIRGGNAPIKNIILNNCHGRIANCNANTITAYSSILNMRGVTVETINNKYSSILVADCTVTNYSNEGGELINSNTSIADTVSTATGVVIGASELINKSFTYKTPGAIDTPPIIKTALLVNSMSIQLLNTMYMLGADFVIAVPISISNLNSIKGGGTVTRSVSTTFITSNKHIVAVNIDIDISLTKIYYNMNYAYDLTANSEISGGTYYSSIIELV